MSFQTDFPKTHAVYQKGIDRGFHFGAQLYIARGDETLADIALGQRDAAGTPLSPDDLMLWKSSGKPVAAVAIAQLEELGKLDFDDPVARHIPEFAQGGKDPVTIRHLLTHQGGFPQTPFSFPPETWEEAIAAVCAMPLADDWIIGETAGYHAVSSWYILGELVARLDGRPYSHYIRDEIYSPLGMDDSFIGMTDTEFDAYESRIAPICNTAKGAQEWQDNHTRPWVTKCIPGANARGPAGQLGLFYRALLAGGSGKRGAILHPDSVANLVARHRVGKTDIVFRHTMDWGLGFILNSNEYGPMTVPYGYGLHASKNAFGHGGRECMSAFADPEHDLVVIAGFNGMPGEPRHNQRVREINTAVYEDLGIE